MASCELVVASPAEGELVLTVSGVVGASDTQRINEAVIAALRSGPVVVRLDLRRATWAERPRQRVVGDATILARHLETELVVVGPARDDRLVARARPTAAVRAHVVRGHPGRQTMLPASATVGGR